MWQHSTQQEQRSYSSLSRSQQKSASVFGSRTVGGGVAGAQESSDCSGNSMREESLRQSTSIPGQSEIATAVDCGRDSRSLKQDDCGNQRSVRHMSTIRVTRKESHRKITPTRTELSDLTQLSSSQKDNIAVQLRNDDSHHYQNNRDRRTRNSIKNNKNDQRNRTSYIGLERAGGERSKKWWRFFKWIPGHKVFKFNTTGTNFGDAITDIESKREEYSMATCYVTGEHRFV